MDNQTDPATAGAPTPVYGPDPVETTSVIDDTSSVKGYGGPTGIGSRAQSFGAVGSAIANLPSEVAGGAPQIAANEAAPSEAAAPAFKVPEGDGFWKNFQDGLTTGANGAETDLRQFSLQDSVDNARANIKNTAGVDIPNPFVGAFAASPTAMADYQTALKDLLAKHQEDTPSDKAIRDAVEPALNMNDYADQWVKDAASKAQMDIAKANGSLIPWLAQFAGSQVGAFRNPINALGLFVGGPELGASSALGRILQEGASQAAIQTGLTGAQEAGRQARAAQLGNETGFWPVMHDLEDSALGGFIGGSVIRGIHEIAAHLSIPTDQGVATEEFLRRAQDVPPPGGWPKGSTQWQKDVADWEAQQARQRSSTAVVPYEGAAAGGEDLTGSSLQMGEGTPPPSEPTPSRPVTPTPAAKPEPPPEIANLPKTTAVTPTAIEARELDAYAAPQVPPNATHADVLETYSGLVKAGEDPDQVGRPVRPFDTPPEKPSSSPESLSLPPVSEMKPGQSFIKDDKPVAFQEFDPTKLQTNAEVFQYKGGGNAQGVTDRLKGVGQWDPIAGSDPMVVYQWSDGREDVVNGHQRTGLARALDAQGSLPEGTRAPGFVFKEADGWSPADVRAYAAKVNLMQGSGDVLDTARILRDRPDIWDKSLPTSDLKLKQAKGLAELSDDGWGMVVNGHVKPDLAALVGQGMPEKSAHSDMLQQIIDFKNADQNSTRMMIADANAAGFREEEQVDIFGSGPVTKSLLRERAEVYSRVVQALRDDKKVFGLLDREVERIESAGNTLVPDANAAQADRASQLTSVLEKLAVRQGPVSAALNRAANLVADGTKAQTAARAFLRDIDRLVREEGLKLTVPPPLVPRNDIDVTTIPGSESAVEEIRQTTPPIADSLFGSHTKPIVEQRQAIFEDWRQKLMDADMPRVQAEANAAVVAARYVARASRLGRTDPETLYREQGLSVRGDRQRAEGKEPVKEGEKAFNQPATVPTFYSSVARAVDSAKLNKASPEQWLATLKNLPAVKPEEVKWLGLEDWLKGQKGPVTKAEVADYVRANQIEVNEVNKGGERASPLVMRAKATEIAARDGQRLEDLRNSARERYMDMARQELGGNAPTKFSSYILPGGENYREMLLTLPVEPKEIAAARDLHQKLSDIADKRAFTPEESAEYDQNLERLSGTRNPYFNPEKAGIYKSSHWDEPNVLAHIRFDDREVSGGRALHLAEVQSDWHQAGRRHGYGPTDVPRGWATTGGAGGGKVPDAPFKTSWPELSMKRMIRYAAENGYDRITWDTGKTNAERYDLSKQVDSVAYSPERKLLTGHKNGELVVERTASPEDLPGLIGKEAADKLLSKPIRHVEAGEIGRDTDSDDVQIVEGEDLKVGGSGMEGFYDKMLPAAVDKLTKKFGGKTEWAKIEHNDPGNMKYEGPARTRDEMIQIARDPRSTSRIVDAAANVASMVNGGFSFQKAMEREGSPDLAERLGGTLNPTATMVPVHSLKLTPELKEAAINEGFPLFAKSSEAEPRGRITLRDDSAVIDLFKNRNASTFVHEAGHKFLDEMAHDAGEDGAPQEIKDDFKTILEWLGAKDAESIGEKEHEKFARGFEQYMREGKAPSEGLRRAFEQFKEWLRSIYRTLVGLGKEIPDNIRAVMDRMIATDDEIAAARAAEHEQLRTAPPTNEELAAQQRDQIVQGVAADVDRALAEDGSPLATELRNDIAKEMTPAAPEPGAKPVEREPAPRPGTKLSKTVDMRSTGLRPKGRGDGASAISAAQVAWSTAIQNGKPAVAGIGAYGWKVLGPRDGLPYGNPYLEVTPEGTARFYDTDLQYGETTEKTAAGDQTIIPGVKPVTDADRAQAGAEKPLKGGNAAPPAGGLFDEDATSQIDLLDMTPTDEGLVPDNEISDQLKPQTAEEKVFFQSARTPADVAREKRQKALAFQAKSKIVDHLLKHRTIDGRRDIFQAGYSLYEDYGYSGFPSVRFLSEYLNARSNGQIADALEHFARKTVYSNGLSGFAGGRSNVADLGELQHAMMGEKSTPEMQRLATGISEVLDNTTRLFNEVAGDTITLRKNWGGPQSHNAAAVYRAGGAKDPIKAMENWVSYIDPLLSWKDMRDPQTGASLERLAQPERTKILRNVWRNIVTDSGLQRANGDSSRRNASIANSRSDHRFFVYKDATSKIGYNRNYGQGDFLSQILGHLRMMNRDIAMMKTFGPNPKATNDWLKALFDQEAAKAKAPLSAEEKAGLAVPPRPTLLEGYAGRTVQMRARWAGNTMDGYYEQFRGGPQDRGTIALSGEILRNITTSALLGKSVIPHAISNPVIQMMGRYYGGIPVAQAIPQIAKAFQHASKEEMMRSGLDAEQGAFELGQNARYAGGLTRAANATRWLPDRVLALTGLHAFVEAMRNSSKRGLVSNLADMQKVPWANLPLKLARKMKGYGITEQDWRILQAATPYQPAQGSAPWLRPMDIEAVGANPQAIRSIVGDDTSERAQQIAFWSAVKFGGYIQGETEIMVPTGSMRMRAYLVGSSDPDSIFGQLRMSATMFKGFIASFMFAQLRANAMLATDRAGIFGNKRRFSMPHAAFVIITMGMLGTVALSLKQMAAGKEAPSTDWGTPEGRQTLLHGMLTGGAFGYMGDFLASDQSSFGRGPLETGAGPVFDIPLDILQGIYDTTQSGITKRGGNSRKDPVEKMGQNVAKGIYNNAPGHNIWYLEAALKRMVFDQLQWMWDPQASKAFRDQEKNLQRNSNQKFWWKPGEVLPHEAPFQHGQ